MKIKIMIIGKMVSGKTTTADHLVETYGFTKISLAQPIKNIEHDLNAGMPKMTIVQKYLNHLDPMQKGMFCNILEETEQIPREEPKPRLRLQFIGTEGGRKRIDDKIWIDLGNRHADAIKGHVVIDDVRFYNEFDYFRKQGWEAIVLKVSPEVQKQRLLDLYGKYDEAALKHDSEQDIDQILNLGDYELKVDTSDLTPQQLKKRIDLEYFDPNMWAQMEREAERA